MSQKQELEAARDFASIIKSKEKSKLMNVMLDTYLSSFTLILLPVVSYVISY